MGGFNWDLVNGEVVRAMLIGLHEARGHGEYVRALRASSNYEVLQEVAVETLGSPPRKAFFEKERVVVDKLREAWLPVVDDPRIRDLAFRVKDASTSPAEPGETRDSQIAYLRDHRNTVTVRRLFREAFLSAHHEPREGSRRTPREFQFMEAFEFRGKGASAEPPPYRHQIKARAELVEMATTARANGEPFRGLLVLPTGAGKTSTAVGWLLDELRRDSDLRVLWLAHQQELALQAMLTFLDLSERLPEGFVREGRLIHSKANSKAVLGWPAVSVAAATYQSLLKNSHKLIARFMERPTIVIVDEAHHAGAPGLDRLLDEIGERPTYEGVLGLTATPNRFDELGARHFVRRFSPPGEHSPHIVHQERFADLIEREVLATPEFHTVETHQLISLTPEEQRTVRRTTQRDIPESVLAKVDSEGRNRLVVSMWVKDQERWGKTLVFAAQIATADALGQGFLDAGVSADRVFVLHSEAGERSDVLTAFRRVPSSEPAVLISVGMLLEGVDLPDARTAFLARPTKSAIVMQQMVGRVLRGPKANGTPDAHIVHFHDDWEMMVDLVSPREALSIPPDAEEAPFVGESELLQEPLSQPPLSEDDVEEEAGGLIEEWGDERQDAVEEANLFSGDLVVRDVCLSGYYDLREDGRLPVFDTYEDVLQALLAETLDGRSIPEDDVSSRLEEYGPPQPPLDDVLELLGFAAEKGEAPVFHVVSRHFAIRDVALDIRSAGALTDDERAARIAGWFDSPLARAAFRSLSRFETAVNKELGRIRSGAPDGDVEQRIPISTGAGLPLLPRENRDLQMPYDLALAHGRSILRGEQRDRLDTAPAPEWTARVHRSTHGHLKTSTPKEGSTLRARLFVNRLYRTAQEHVGDHIIGFIVWHEVLHHVLPSQGHDDEFRELEETWPDMAGCSGELFTLHERWNTDPKAYEGLR